MKQLKKTKTLPKNNSKDLKSSWKLFENVLEGLVGGVAAGDKKLGEILDYPQEKMMELFTGTKQKPSKALQDAYPNGFTKHPATELGVDLVADPLNLLSFLKAGKYGDTAIKSLGATTSLKETKDKFAFGGTVGSDPLSQQMQLQYQKKKNRPNYIQSPDEALVENDIATAKAMEKASSNPWTQGLDILGTTALNAGMDMMGKGIGGGSAKAAAIGGTPAGLDLPDISQLLDFQMPKFNNTIPQIKAFGGRVKGGKRVEVEGKEVAMTPSGKVIDFEGPTHEKGGVQTTLPENTQVFSDRIKGPDNKTMAKRKANRDKKIKRFSDRGKSDILSKNAADRMSKTFSFEDQKDLETQELFASQMDNQDSIQQFKFGTGRMGIGDPEDLEGASVVGGKKMQMAGLQLPAVPSYMPTLLTPEELALPNFSSPVATPKSNTTGDIFEMLKGQAKDLPTPGDALGMFGNLKQAYDPYNTTLQSRATDTPHTNQFKDFGKDTLAAIDSMKDFAVQNRDHGIKALQDKAISQRGSLRNGARGINTMRALDIATNNASMDAIGETTNNFATQMMNILGQEANALNQRDNAVMSGEQTANTNNREDKDAFFSQVANDQARIGEAITGIGKNMNDIKGRNVNNNFLNQIYDYVDGDLKSGNISVKDGADVTRDSRAKSAADKTGKEKIDASVYNNLLNPSTGKAFTEKEWRKHDETRNEWSLPLEEVDASYKDLVEPNSGKPFTSKSQLDKYVNTPGRSIDDLKKYEKPLSFSGTSFGKNLPTRNRKEAGQVLQQYMEKNGIASMNIDNKEDVKNLQKMLGIKQDGIYGKGVFDAIKSALK